MNRKQKIIVSITGIVIVVLALLGLTYAYFVTAIQGNENDKSIEVTTANLRLIYGDGNGTITATNIMPGTTIDTKTFTVTNDGNATTRYAVYLENVVNTFTNTEDVKITMTCTDNNNDTCNGIESSFPAYNDLLLFNNIGVGITQTYRVTVEYLETGVDQSVDMGKSLSGKFQIYNMNDIIDITGFVSPPDHEQAYVELVNDIGIVKKSNIVNGDNPYFELLNVSPGEYRVFIRNENGEIITSETSPIMVNKSSDENISLGWICCE